LWKYLPDYLFYVDVVKPHQKGTNQNLQSMWGYVRGKKTWKGVASIPALLKDPLFAHPDEPATIFFPPRRGAGGKQRGAAILCPGGNYEFLMPHEGQCIASWFAQQGIPAYVLRYRLQPKYGIGDALDDLSAAVKQVLKDQGGGPVCLLGFSAGAHLCASFSAAGLGRCFRQAAGLRDGDRQLAQVLLYPCLAGSEWADPNRASWWGPNWKDCEKLGRGPQLAKYDLVHGKPVADVVPAAATFLVHSTQDYIVHPTEHSDLYVRRVKAYNRQKGSGAQDDLSMVYLRGAFGDHGFGLLDLWGARCLAWMKQLGFAF
jgi:acetyl esterase/lipase